MGKNCFVTALTMLLLLASLSHYALTAAGSEVHDVAVTDVTIFPTFIWGGGYITSNVTVENQGTSHETFNVTVYAYNKTFELAVYNLTITDLAPGTNITLTLEWSIFPFRFEIWRPPWPVPPTVMIANFTIKVEAEAVLGEVDTADNVYVDGMLTVKWVVADITGDGRIDMKDIAPVALAFGSYPGHPRWYSILDIYYDGKVDIRDIAGVATRFGWVYV